MLLDESPCLPPLAPPVDRSRRYTRILLLLFLCTLPRVNPIVHGDGVGYYAYVRAPLIQHNLRFEEDWRHADLNFSQFRTMPNGELGLAFVPTLITRAIILGGFFRLGSYTELSWDWTAPQPCTTDGAIRLEPDLRRTRFFPQAVRLSIKLTIRYPIQSANLESARCRWFL